MAAVEKRLRVAHHKKSPTLGDATREGGGGRQVVAVYCGGMISPVRSMRDLLYWLVARVGEETGTDCCVRANSWVMRRVELPQVALHL
jgi:hypothetical protein